MGSCTHINEDFFKKNCNSPDLCHEQTMFQWAFSCCLQSLESKYHCSHFTDGANKALSRQRWLSHGGSLAVPRRQGISLTGSPTATPSCWFESSAGGKEEGWRATSWAPDWSSYILLALGVGQAQPHENSNSLAHFLVTPDRPARLTEARFIPCESS